MSEVRFLLASNSPRRRQLLSWTGWPFIVQPADIDETPLPGEKTEAYTLRLARGKAKAGAVGVPAGTLVLAADTTVADDQGLLGKPGSAEEARSMLRRLRGCTHRVITALAIYDPQTERLLDDTCTARVPMRAYSDEEIEAYVLSGDPLDKAGAYAIQHPGFHPVEHFSGCYACVVGLPLCHLVRTLRKLGIQPLRPVPATCQANLAYDCPVYPEILENDNAG